MATVASRSVGRGPDRVREARVLARLERRCPANSGGMPASGTPGTGRSHSGRPVQLGHPVDADVLGVPERGQHARPAAAPGPAPAVPARGRTSARPARPAPRRPRRPAAGWPPRCPCRASTSGNRRRSSLEHRRVRLHRDHVTAPAQRRGQLPGAGRPGPATARPDPGPDTASAPSRRPRRDSRAGARRRPPRRRRRTSPRARRRWLRHAGTLRPRRPPPPRRFGLPARPNLFR